MLDYISKIFRIFNLRIMQTKKLPIKDSHYFWVLDPGHGGVLDGVYQTKGKRSPVWEDGSVYYEGEGNRFIIADIAKELDNLGIHYGFTVHPDDPKDVPLRDRVKIADGFNFKRKIGISNHSDGFSNPSAHGHTVYTSVGETQSDKVATIFHEEAKKVFPNMKFRTDKKDGDPDKESQFYILRKTAMPFILLENFFHTNPLECKTILMTKEGRAKIVKYIVNAIIRIEKYGL